MVDVSRNVVAGLLLLVILVSGVSTYYALWGARSPPPMVNSENGEVQLQIVGEGFGAAEASSATGHVVLYIQRPEGQNP